MPARTRLTGCIELLAARFHRHALTSELLTQLRRLRPVRLAQLIGLHHQMLAVAIGLHPNLAQLAGLLHLQRLDGLHMPLPLTVQRRLQLPHLLAIQHPLALGLGQLLL